MRQPETALGAGIAAPDLRPVVLVGDAAKFVDQLKALGITQFERIPATEIDLTETFAFVKLLGELGVKILNTTAGSPYYNPHIQRPAAYPPSDGYQPAHDPLKARGPARVAGMHRAQSFR